MKGTTVYPESDPRHHTMKMRATLDDLIGHLRADVGKVSAPKAKALFETSAEVLIGLRTAFEHYEMGAEPAMREPSLRDVVDLLSIGIQFSPLMGIEISPAG